MHEHVTAWRRRADGLGSVAPKLHADAVSDFAFKGGSFESSNGVNHAGQCAYGSVDFVMAEYFPRFGCPVEAI